MKITQVKGECCMCGADIWEASGICVDGETYCVTCYEKRYNHRSMY